MPDVSSTAPAEVCLWVALDVHKFSIVAATLPAVGGVAEVQQIETSPAAIRRFIQRLGGPAGLAVCYEAGPGGYELLRLLSGLGVACDVVAPSLVPVRAGDRVKTDRREAGAAVPRRRAAVRGAAVAGARGAARSGALPRRRAPCAHRGASPVAKQLLPHGRVYREGKKAWTHATWRAQRLEHPLAERALEHARAHLDSLDAQLAALDAELAQIARRRAVSGPVRWLCAFRGVGYRTALGLLVGLLRRFDRKLAVGGEWGRIRLMEVVVRPPEVFVRPLAHDEAMAAEGRAKKAKHFATRERAAILVGVPRRQLGPADRGDVDDRRVACAPGHPRVQRARDGLAGP